MSETKKSVASLQEEYSKLCAKAGHLNYQLYVIKAELETVNASLKEINLEAAASAASEKAESEKSDEQAS